VHARFKTSIPAERKGRIPSGLLIINGSDLMLKKSRTSIDIGQLSGSTRCPGLRSTSIFNRVEFFFLELIGAECLYLSRIRVHCWLVRRNW
jgi:hypothetical protein